MVRFVPCKVRCGGTVHNGGDIGLSGFRPIGVTQWLNSDRTHRRQVDCIIGVGGGWSTTDIVPAVQPERRQSDIEPMITHRMDPLHGKQRVYIAYGTMSVDHLCARDYCKRTFTHRPVNCYANQGWRWNYELIIKYQENIKRVRLRQKFLTLMVNATPRRLLKLIVGHRSKLARDLPC